MDQNPPKRRRQRRLRPRIRDVKDMVAPPNSMMSNRMKYDEITGRFAQSRQRLDPNAGTCGVDSFQEMRQMGSSSPPATVDGGHVLARVLVTFGKSLD